MMVWLKGNRNNLLSMRKNIINLLNGQIDKKTEKMMVTFFLFVFVIGMICFSKTTSPLFPYEFGADSAIFSLLGKSMLNGKTLYKDLFDHKGPVLFFIEALGHLIGGRNGIFLLQCIIGIINLRIIYFLCKSETKANNNWFLMFFFILILCYGYFYFTFQGGNLSEEYSLPLISLCVLLFSKYANQVNDSKEHPPFYSLIYGVCVGLIALIRINNAISIFAGILVIIVFLIVNKRYKNVILNFVAGIIGCLLVVIPVLIYFHFKGALNEMIYATFTYNFLYAFNKITSNEIMFSLEEISAKLPVILSLFLSIKYLLKNKLEFIDCLYLFVLLLNAILFFCMSNYTHYYVIFVPVYALILARYWEFNALSNTLFALSFCLSMVYPGGSLILGVYKTYISSYSYDIYNGVVEMFDFIPEDEKDSVIGFNCSSAYYLMGEIIPCYKYYTLQEWWASNNPEILTDFVDYIDNENPLWVFILPDEDNVEVLDVLEYKYSLVKSNKWLNMYRLAERQQ